MTIKISEVLAAFEAMTAGEWSADVWYGTNGEGWAAVGPRHSNHDETDEPGCHAEQRAQHDAAGIVATHNAMPVLLDVVEAALAYEAAGREAIAAEAQFDDWTDAFDKLKSAEDAYRAALAKVSR